MPLTSRPSAAPRDARARRRASRLWVLAALPLAAACTDRSATLPSIQQPSPTALPVAECRVSVAEMTMVCTDARRPQPAASRARGDKLLGGQDVYVRLSSSGTSYDSGTQILSSNVTVQNLLRQSMGTDGVTMSPIRVFFVQEPTRTGGTGSVSLYNGADGSDMFTGSNQPYYSYNQILTPYQISSARTWMFQMDPTVTAFVFQVYVSAPLADYSGTLLDHVWEGDDTGDPTNWSLGANWNLGVAPDSGSTVAIPADSLLPSHTSPVLTTDVAITNLRVGSGSTLGLATHTLVAWGNVDAVGAISGGTIWSRGTGALLGGNVSALQVSGSASLQRSTVATGAVSVTGTLAVKDQALSIQIP